MTKKFEDIVIEGVQQIQNQQKAFADDITRLKNNANDFQAKLAAIQRFHLQERQVASAFAASRLASIPEEIRRGIGAKLRQMHKAPFSAADAKAYDELVVRALGEDSSPGSTLISDGIIPEIYNVLGSYGKFNTLGVRRMGTKITKLPISTVRPKAQWILTEAGEIDEDSEMDGTSENLEVEMLGVLLSVSYQLLEDSESDVATEVLDQFLQALSERLDHSAFAADGVADGDEGGFTGIVNFGTAAAAGSGNTTIESTDFADWVKCLTTVAPAVLSRKAKWWMHPTTLARTLNVVDGNGRPIFLTAVEAPAFGGIGSILGYPVELVHAMPSANEASAPVAAFGDPDGYVVGLRTDFRLESSDHFRWNKLQRAFRGWGRAGCKGRRSTAFAVLTLAAS